MNWDDLRQMRAKGLRPSLPVIIATKPSNITRTLDEEGCGVIIHKPGERFHVELLDELRVWLFLDDCGRAQAIIRSMNSKGVHPAEFSAWCPCMRRMDSQPVSCDVAAEWA